VLLEVRGVGRLPEIKPASFEVHAGEIVGIGGLVGAGRTELLRLIYGLDPADDGEVVVDGKRLPGGNPAAAIAAGLGLAPEDRKSQGLLLEWSLANNVTLADLGKYRRRGLLSPRAERKAAGELLAELNTKPDNPRALARELSGGNQQKVVLARWLMRQCKVMLFDEPTRGVDVGAKAEIYRLITDLSKAGKGLLVVSSELPELIGLCTRILVMREGEIVADVPGDEATEFELLRHSVIHPESVPEEIK
jgi:ribose transport system ATP-binding protein